MTKAKKSVFYLLMSLTLMGIIVASMLVFSNRFKKLESSSIEVVGNEFISTTISDISEWGLDRFMEVASKKALETLASYMALGNSVANVTEAFDSLVANGTINGTMMYLAPTLNKFLGAETNYYFVLGFSISRISISSSIGQAGPWNLAITSEIEYRVSVPRTQFMGMINTVKITNVSILGLPDPVDGWRVTPSWGQNESYPSYSDMLFGITSGSENGICREC